MIKEYEIIGYDQVRSWLSHKCSFDGNRDKFANLIPIEDLETITNRHSYANEILEQINGGSAPPEDSIGDIDSIIDSLLKDGYILSIDDITLIHRVLILYNRYIQYLKKESMPIAYTIIDTSFDSGHLVSMIEKVFDTEYNIKDNASKELSRITKKIKELSKEKDHELSKLLRSAKRNGWLNGDEVHLKNGRSVLPVRPGSKKLVSGIVHDRSSSGQTIFIEPAVSISIENHIADEQINRRNEIKQILTRLTSEVANFSSHISKLYHKLMNFDFHSTIAKLAIETGAIRPEISEKIHIKNGTNPVFIFQKKQYVPIDIDMCSGNRTIIISGPNAGGKTIAIKTLGLFAIMSQSGLFIPASVARLPVFDNIFIDIGDNQSLENDLSTFTGHIMNIKRFTEDATKSSLILIDEIGSGTEPEAGAGIAEAILDNLHSIGCYLLATTHFTSLKNWARETEEADNAGMGFDLKDMEPSYRIASGTPGASYGIEIAEIVGLNKGIIKKSKSLISSGSTKLDKLIADIEQQASALETQINNLDNKEHEINSIRDELTRMKGEIDERYKSSKRDAAIESKLYLESQRKKIESVVESIRKKEASKEAILAGRDSLSDINSEITKEIERNKIIDYTPLDINGIELGMSVYYNDIDEYGAVEILPDKKGNLSVSMNGKNIYVHYKKLSASDKSSEEEPAGQHRLQVSAPAGMRLDIRGKRMDDAIQELEQFIDSSVAYGMSVVEVLHGKGEGVLMSAVHRYLSEQGHVKGYGFASDDAGGTGITIVEL